MTRRLGIVAVVVLLLAGCAPAATPGETPAASPTASPTAEPQSDPQPILPLTCDGLLSDSEASEVVQYGVSLKVDAETIYRPYQVGAHQVGATLCWWGAENKTDNNWDQHVQVTILPGADQDWQSGVWQVDDGAIVYPDGSTTSEYLCSQVLDYYSKCIANLLVNGYWAQVDVQSIGISDGRTAESAAASMRTVLDLFAARIAAAAEPRAAWVEPAGSLKGSYCTESAPAILTHAMYVAATRAGYVTCSTEGWNVAVQPGGAWAIPHLVGQDFSYALKNAQPATLEGADGGAWACGDGCMGVYAVNGSAVSISGDVRDEPTFSAKAAEILAAVVAAG